MTQSGYSSALVNLTLGWLKGLASWVLKLFNLAGSGGSPLLWLSQNWLKLLIFCLILGLVIDWLVWMIRWRPYWVWFRKKRIVVNDERFLSGKYEDEESDDFDRRYVVPSTIVSRRVPAKKPAARSSANNVKRSGTVQRRSAAVRSGNAVAARTNRPPVRKMPVKSASPDELFEVGSTQQEYSGFYEDDVFDVSSLPDRPNAPRKARKRSR